MNKYITYCFLAILLGIITITVPISLFNIEDNQNSLYDKNNDRGLVPEGIDNTFESTTTEMDLKSPVLGLQSIGLLVVPSLLIALGIFVLIRRRFS